VLACFSPIGRMAAFSGERSWLGCYIRRLALNIRALLLMADQLDKSAEKPLESTGLHSQGPVANRVFLRRVELQRSLQNTQDRVQVVAALFSIERSHRHGFQPEGGGMPLSSESRLAENSSPAHPISAKRPPNARAPRRILRFDSTQGLPQALRISS
jgi:hypothetical protein